MEEHDQELLDTLKKRPDQEPDIEFSNQVRQKLQMKNITKRQHFSVATVLTIPVTIVVLAFLTMISTGQSLELKSAAQFMMEKEKNLVLFVSIILLMTLLLFIVFVYRKGYTKGRLVYMTFSLSFAAWIGALVYEESQRLDEPIVLSTYSESFDYDRSQLIFMYVTNKKSEETIHSLTIGPYTIQQENDMEEIQQELHNYTVKTVIFSVDRAIVQYVKQQPEALKEAQLTFQTPTDTFEIKAPIEKLATIEPAVEKVPLEEITVLQKGQAYDMQDTITVYKALHDVTITDIIYPEDLQQQIDIKILRLVDINPSILTGLKNQCFEDFPEDVLVENALPFILSKDETFAFTFISKTPSYNKKVYDALLTIRSDRGESYHLVRMIPTLSEPDIEELRREKDDERSL